MVARLNTVYELVPVAQTKSWSCWAAAAAMLYGWKTGVQTSELAMAKLAGPRFEQAFLTNSGLPGVEIARFANSISLRSETPQNYSPTGYNDILKSYGPLWIGTALFSPTVTYRHVRVLRGIVGDGDYETTTAYLVDPDGGTEYEQTVGQLAKELEEIAREDLGSEGPGNLNPQIIRFV